MTQKKENATHVMGGMLLGFRQTGSGEWEQKWQLKMRVKRENIRTRLWMPTLL